MELESIFQVDLIIACLAIAAIVTCIRAVVEYFISRDNKAWRNLVLPILPILVGLVLSSLIGGLLLGLTCGLLSGFVYKVVKDILKSKSEKKDETA